LAQLDKIRNDFSFVAVGACLLGSSLAIEDVRNVSNEEKETQPQQSFRDGVRHPPCVRHLLRHGVPSDMGCDKARTLLARYVAAKGLNDVQGTKMAKTMLKHSDFLSAGMGEGPEMRQFAECLARARDTPKTNHWSCEDVWASKKLRECGACTGWCCEYYHPESCVGSSRQGGNTEAQIEQEALTYLLRNPGSISEGLVLDLRCEGFVDEYECRDGTCLPLNRVLWHVCRYLVYHGRPIRCTAILASISRNTEMRPHVDEIEQYVQWLQSQPPCRRGRFHEYSNVIDARGARLRAQELVRQAVVALDAGALPLDVILSTLGQQSRALSVTACDKSRLFERELSNFMTNLFSNKCDAIPTRSEWLNASLGGGWKPGSLYVVNASSGVEATDFSAWCAEFAAQRRFPTLFISWGTSKDDFTERALVRHCGVDVKVLSRYRKNGFYDGDATVLERVVEAGERLSRRVAPYLVMTEANSEMTASDVSGAVSAAQDRISADHDRPTLLILDQLPVQSSDSGGSSGSVGKRGFSDKNSLVEGVKRQMQDSTVATIAAFSKIETLSRSHFEKEEVDTALFHRDLGGLNAADCTLTLHSRYVRVGGATREKKIDQFDLAREWYKRSYPRSQEYIDQHFSEAKGDLHLDEATSSYARISLCGKGASTLANPVIIYEWLYHRFRTLKIEPMGLDKHGPLAFDDASPGL
jgi:hypothetical protein